MKYYEMNDNQEKINLLFVKLARLLEKQNDFSLEIENLRIEIERLKFAEEKRGIEAKGTQNSHPEHIIQETIEETSTSIPVPKQQALKNPVREQEVSFEQKTPKEKSDLEKFIGENLINKIGIIIIILGVAIGAKYAIDHELISPLTRIVIGYLVGLGLLGFAIKLKKKYENFSAVLLSGSLTILYFITFLAYSLYNLIPQSMAFGLMVIFTVFTVIAAINYSKQIIAHIGLVGAYAVPFLLSEGSGKVGVLFSYMAIINIGILFISLKKYWKPLYYSSFGLTWIIYLMWYSSKYQTDTHFALASLFLVIFFVTFYLTFLGYKILEKENFEVDDIILLLANSFIFFGIGYAILDNHESGAQLLGLFTLGNAIVHFIVSAIIYRKQLADKNLFFLVSGLVLLFITIAIPVQLDGNWVTLLWAGEAALLFWIGKSKNVPVYEKLAYPLMFLAFFSIIHDWTTLYNGYYTDRPETKITPLFNINFLSSLLFIPAFGFINRINQKIESQGKVSKVIAFAIPAILIFTVYYAFRIEIATYFNQLYTDSKIAINIDDSTYPYHYWNDDLRTFKTIWIINYSLCFVSVLAYVNFKKLKKEQLGLVTFILIATSLLIFLVQGLYALSELRESYLEQTLSEYYHRGIWNIAIRYISFIFVAMALFIDRMHLNQSFFQKNLVIPFNFLLHITILWIVSSELIHWLDMAHSTQSYKLGLSILWGVYSLFLIALGIWKKKQYLRIGAIALFAVTLIKLFFYDISHLDTISKTVVFVSLGALLLIISFLYNKYKHIISDEAAI